MRGTTAADVGTPGGMKIRAARLEDAARIAEVHVHAWQAAYRGIMPDTLLDNLSVVQRRAFWEKRIALNEATVLVAETEGVVCGWLTCGRSRDPGASPGVLEIYGLYVDPAAWRRGAGTLLWTDAMRRVDQAAVAEVTLWVIVENVRARAFYEAVGFRPEAGRVKQVERGGEVLSEIRYRLRLR
jgi:ribosomal protein S18 acetylase RimI-like enzyme